MTAPWRVRVPSVALAASMTALITMGTGNATNDLPAWALALAVVMLFAVLYRGAIALLLHDT